MTATFVMLCVGWWIFWEICYSCWSLFRCRMWNNNMASTHFAVISMRNRVWWYDRSTCTRTVLRIWRRF